MGTANTCLRITTVYKNDAFIRLIGKGKRTICSIYLPPTDQVTGRYERPPGAAPSTNDPAGRFQRTQSTMGKRENEHKRKNDALTKKKKPSTEQLMAANRQ